MTTYTNLLENYLSGRSSALNSKSEKVINSSKTMKVQQNNSINSESSFEKPMSKGTYSSTFNMKSTKRTTLPSEESRPLAKRTSKANNIIDFEDTDRTDTTIDMDSFRVMRAAKTEKMLADLQIYESQPRQKADRNYSHILKDITNTIQEMKSYGDKEVIRPPKKSKKQLNTSFENHKENVPYMVPQAYPPNMRKDSLSRRPLVTYADSSEDLSVSNISQHYLPKPNRSYDNRNSYQLDEFLPERQFFKQDGSQNRSNSNSQEPHHHQQNVINTHLDTTGNNIDISNFRSAEPKMKVNITERMVTECENFLSPEERFSHYDPHDKSHINIKPYDPTMPDVQTNSSRANKNKSEIKDYIKKCLESERKTTTSSVNETAELMSRILLNIMESMPHRDNSEEKINRPSNVSFQPEIAQGFKGPSHFMSTSTGPSFQAVKSVDHLMFERIETITYVPKRKLVMSSSAQTEPEEIEYFEVDLGSKNTLTSAEALKQHLVNSRSDYTESLSMKPTRLQPQSTSNRKAIHYYHNQHLQTEPEAELNNSNFIYNENEYEANNGGHSSLGNTGEQFIFNHGRLSEKNQDYGSTQRSHGYIYQQPSQDELKSEHSYDGYEEGMNMHHMHMPRDSERISTVRSQEKPPKINSSMRMSAKSSHNEMRNSGEMQRSMPKKKEQKANLNLSDAALQSNSREPISLSRKSQALQDFERKAMFKAHVASDRKLPKPDAGEFLDRCNSLQKGFKEDLAKAIQQIKHNKSYDYIDTSKREMEEDDIPLDSADSRTKTESNLEYSLTNSQFSKFQSLHDMKAQSARLKGNSVFTSIQNSVHERDSFPKKLSSRTMVSPRSSKMVSGWIDVVFHNDNEVENLIKAYTNL